MAGIKLHAAIDVVIRGNHIHHTCRGLWLDWMAQGTRVSANLFHNNDQDIFVEVDHGPFLVDNNLLLSGISLLDMSEGGAYAYNLLTGKIISRPELGRSTPYHPAHSTAVAGLCNIQGGDDRFYNNILVGSGSAAADKPSAKDPKQAAAGFGLWVYDARPFPLQTGGNVYLNYARPYRGEAKPTVDDAADPEVKIVEEGPKTYLRLTLGQAVQRANTVPVTTALLGKAKIAGLAYENADGSPLKVDTDYFGKKRNAANPTAGPFENPGSGPLNLKVW